MGIFFGGKHLSDLEITLLVSGEQIYLSMKDYDRIKEDLFTKHQNGESFTFDEWQLFSAILDREIKNAEGVEVKDVEGEKIMPQIVNQVN